MLLTKLSKNMGNFEKLGPKVTQESDQETIVWMLWWPIKSKLSKERGRQLWEIWNNVWMLWWPIKSKFQRTCKEALRDWIPKEKTRKWPRNKCLNAVMTREQFSQNYQRTCKVALRNWIPQHHQTWRKSLDLLEVTSDGGSKGGGCLSASTFFVWALFCLSTFLKAFSEDFSPISFTQNLTRKSLDLLEVTSVGGSKGGRRLSTATPGFVCNFF